MRAAPGQLSFPLSDLLDQQDVNQGNEGAALKTPLCCPTHPFTETVEILKNIRYFHLISFDIIHLFNPVLCLVDLELTLPLLLPGSVDCSTSSRGHTRSLRNFETVKKVK